MIKFNNKGMDLMRKYLTIGFISFIFLFLAACGKTTYEVDQEVSVEFAGYDEYGTAVLNFDKVELSNNLKTVVELKNANDSNNFESFMAGVEIQATPLEDLKNGDEIKLDLTYYEDNPLKIELKLKNSTVTVDGLEPVTALSQDDIFSGIDVQFEGISPFLSVTITENSSSDVSSLFNYSIPEKRFENGEEFEITAEPKSDLLSEGYKVDDKDLKQTVEVPTQAKYVEAWDELSEDDQNFVLDEIHDQVTASVDSQLPGGGLTIYDKGSRALNGRYVEKIGKSKAIEQFFLHVKENQSLNRNEEVNSVRVVFKNNFTAGSIPIDIDGYGNSTNDLHMIVGASNLIVDDNGSLIRSDLNVDLLGRTDIDKETVKNNALYQVKDKYTMDEFSLDDVQDDDQDEDQDEEE